MVAKRRPFGIASREDPTAALDDSIYFDHETFSLQILRSCRQTYNDFTRTLWSTNTFSFNDSLKVERSSVREGASRRICRKSLRLYTDWDFNEHEEWTTALKIATVRPLQGLWKLRSRIEWSMASGVYRSIKQQTHFPNHTRFIEGSEKLATLPLTSVEIAVKKSPFRESRKHGKTNDRGRKGWSMPESYAKCSSVQGS